MIKVECHSWDTINEIASKFINFAVVSFHLGRKSLKQQNRQGKAETEAKNTFT